MKDINYNKVKAAKDCLSDLATHTSTRKDEQTIRASQLLDEYIRDETKILQSRAFRRLSKKAQIVPRTENANVRNREVHTLEVTSIAIRIAYYLGLNVNLTRAMALGHDLGHVPFGHQGEHFLAQRSGKDFNHRIMGIIIAQKIERDGRGLNLCKETLDGMYYHSGPEKNNSMTQEAKILHYADRIANVFADANDFGRLGYKADPALQQALDYFGEKQRDRVDTAVAALCEESQQEHKVSFEKSEDAKKFFQLEALMYEIYPKISIQDVSHLLNPIYDFFESTHEIDPVLAISLMTDDDIFFLLPKDRNINWEQISQTSLGEILHVIKGLQIDLSGPDLHW